MESKTQLGVSWIPRTDDACDCGVSALFARDDIFPFGICW